MGAVFYVQVRDDPELVKLEDRVDKRASEAPYAGRCATPLLVQEGSRLGQHLT